MDSGVPSSRKSSLGNPETTNDSCERAERLRLNNRSARPLRRDRKRPEGQLAFLVQRHSTGGSVVGPTRTPCRWHSVRLASSGQLSARQSQVATSFRRRQPARLWPAKNLALGELHGEHIRPARIPASRRKDRLRCASVSLSPCERARQAPRRRPVDRSVATHQTTRVSDSPGVAHRLDDHHQEMPQPLRLLTRWNATSIRNQPSRSSSSFCRSYLMRNSRVWLGSLTWREYRLGFRRHVLTQLVVADLDRRLDFLGFSGCLWCFGGRVRRVVNQPDRVSTSSMKRTSSGLRLDLLLSNQSRPMGCALYVERRPASKATRSSAVRRSML